MFLHLFLHFLLFVFNHLSFYLLFFHFCYCVFFQLVGIIQASKEHKLTTSDKVLGTDNKVDKRKRKAKMQRARPNFDKIKIRRLTSKTEYE